MAPYFSTATIETNSATVYKSTAMLDARPSSREDRGFIPPQGARSVFRPCVIDRFRAELVGLAPAPIHVRPQFENRTAGQYLWGAGSSYDISWSPRTSKLYTGANGNVVQSNTRRISFIGATTVGYEVGLALTTRASYGRYSSIKMRAIRSPSTCTSIAPKTNGAKRLILDNIGQRHIPPRANMSIFGTQSSNSDRWQVLTTKAASPN